jgi:hypothetical protein
VEVIPSLRTWRLLAPAAAERLSIYVVLARSRTCLERATLAIGGAGAERTVELSVASDRLLRGDLPERCVEAEVPVELRIEYLGDAPQVAQVRWVAKAAEGFSRLTPPRGFFPAELRQAALAQPQPARRRRRASSKSAAEGSGATPSAEGDLFEVRRQALEAETRVRRFFLELDERIRGLSVAEELRLQIERVTYVLFQRIEMRAQFGREGRVPDFQLESVPSSGSLLRASLRPISKVFAELVDAHLQGEQMTDWAFEQFAVCACSAYHHDPRKHRLLQSCGAPDGAEFFKFAELALICLEHGVDRRLWSRLLPTLVRSSHLFAELAEEPAAGEARMTGANNYAFQQGRFCRMDRREARQDEYRASLSALTEAQQLELLTHRFTSILAQAFKDTRLGATSLDDRYGPLLHTVVLERELAAPAPTVEV